MTDTPRISGSADSDFLANNGRNPDGFADLSPSATIDRSMSGEARRAEKSEEAQTVARPRGLAAAKAQVTSYADRKKARDASKPDLRSPKEELYETSLAARTAERLEEAEKKKAASPTWNEQPHNPYYG